jgi:signal transduction histidine kinase
VVREGFSFKLWLFCVQFITFMPMAKPLFLCLCLLLLFTELMMARTYTEPEARAAWEALKKQPVSDDNFRKTCDLIQDIGQTNIQLSYEILQQYVPMVKATGNHQWVHVLLMGWAKAKESFVNFDEAELLYRQARENAANLQTGYDEALVGTVLMYLEWGREDSLAKYLRLGDTVCRRAADKENLSFIYTFKAMSHMDDTASMRNNLDSAIQLAETLANKNALFTAHYNRAVFSAQFNLQQQVSELGTLLELAKDSTLTHKPRLYERTAFYFRNPGPSIYYQLVLVNLLLTDYDNAGKFAELFYNETVLPNPNGAQAPYFNSVMAMVKAYQGSYSASRDYLGKSLTLFGVPENKIVYPTYFLAAGMLSEQAGQYNQSVSYYAEAFKNGSMSYGLHLMPPGIYYAHGLILTRKLDSAEKIFEQLGPALKTRTYSAIGFYYYQYYSELLKAKGDYAAYTKALETFYAIKDSLTNLNHFRAIQEVETRLRVLDKERQIGLLNEENDQKLREIREGRFYLILFTSLAALIILLLFGYGRTQYLRKQQAEQITVQNDLLQQNKMKEMEKQHRIEVMQGAIDAEESERHKIADQLHDETGGMLALASLNISSVLEKGAMQGISEEKLSKTGEILSSVSTTIRNISHRLTPLIIEKYGFRKSIEDLAYTINLSEKLALETVIVGFEEDTKYPVNLLNNLYRIIQELLHNVIKHAQAQHALVELVEHEKHISIMVEDDGVGIGDYSKAKGKGLLATQSKIAYLNGKMEIIKKNDRGTLVVIELVV